MGIYYILIVISLALGVLIGYIFSDIKNRKIISKNNLKISEYDRLTEDLGNLKNEKYLIIQKYNELEKDKAKLDERINNLGIQITNKNIIIDKYEEKLEKSNSDISAIREELAEEKTKIDEREKKLSDLRSQFEEQKRGLKEEFKNLSNDILKEKEETLKKDNNEGISNLLKPLKEQISNFQTRVNQVHDEQTKSSSKLFGQIESLNKMNENLKDEAENLANALKNDKKTLGNWGEIQVEMLLDDSGLIKGREYKREDNFKSLEGENKRPDFVIYLPENKHIVIDSKVSLNDYVKSVNSESSEVQQNALQDLAACVKRHIDQLSSKDYSSLVGINSPDFVFMFMPIETAYLAAFETDPLLFDYAYKKKVAVVTPNTLLPILRTVSSLWDIEKQNQSTKKIADSASKVYDKLEVFSRKFMKVENNISRLNSTYIEAQRSLVGPRSLFSMVENFRELGVKVRKELPQDFSEPILINNTLEESEI